MDCSTPGLPVHYQLPEFTQTQVHWVGDAIQPSHPLSSPSPPALNLSQHQGLFKELVLGIRWPKYWSSASTSVLPMNISFPFFSFPCGSAGKESVCNAGDLGSIPGLGRSPGEGKGYPLQYSGLGHKESNTIEQLSLVRVSKLKWSI